MKNESMGNGGGRPCRMSGDYVCGMKCMGGVTWGVFFCAMALGGLSLSTASLGRAV